METNGRFPSVPTRALKDWLGNCGWNVLMNQITSHGLYFGMCQSPDPRFVSAALVHVTGLQILLHVWCSDRVRLRCCSWLGLRSHSAAQMGHVNLHLTVRPAPELKPCAFPLCSITALFRCRSPTCLCLLEQRKPLPATHTTKWRLMKWYRRPGQTAGCRRWRSGVEKRENPFCSPLGSQEILLSL